MLLQKLVQIPSINPDHASPGQEKWIGEQRMADFLTEWLKEIGAEVTLEEIEPSRPNLIARFAPLDGRPRILLGPHLDTVGIDNMTIPPFSGEIRDSSETSTNSRQRPILAPLRDGGGLSTSCSTNTVNCWPPSTASVAHPI